MVRFQPDTFVETLLRPLVMAAPDGNVYIEIMAPDFRFAFALLLLALLGALSLLRPRRAARKEGPPPRTVFVLLGAVIVGIVAWMATSANGRYFVAGLLLVGPLCVGLASLLPVTRALRLTLAAGMVALQAFVVHQSAPLHAWTFASWKQAPYFQVDVPPELRARPATYVTMSSISYSLVAPLFHPGSRWMSLYNAPAADSPLQDARRAQAFLSKADPARLMLLVPVLDGMQTPEGLPNAQVAEAMNTQLARHRLAFAQPQSCRFLASRGLAGMGLGEKTEQERARAGFWLCQLQRIDPAAAPGTPPRHRHDAVFRVLEAQCPRFFPAGGDGGTTRIPTGEMRSYLQAEMKAYVYDNGEVHYKYYRALNAVRVGTIDDVVAGQSKLDCARIRGRAGLPWEREI